MGAANAKAVIGCWSDLPDKPYRLLMFMALVTKDADDAPVFYGGRESLALGGLGRDVIGASPAARHAAFEAVASGIAILLRVGAIKRITEPCPGRTAEYELQLRPRPPVDKAKDATGAACTEQPGTVQDQPVVNPVDNPCGRPSGEHRNGTGSPCATVQAQPADGTGSACGCYRLSLYPRRNKDLPGLTEEQLTPVRRPTTDRATSTASR